MDVEGKWSREEKPIADILRASDLHIRDFISLESPTVTTIHTTRKAIVVAMSHVRIVIHPNEVHFYQTHRPIVKDFIQSMSEYLSLCTQMKRNAKVNLDFGVICLEGVFSSVATKYARRVYCFQPVLDGTLKDLRKNELKAAQRRTIARMLPLRNSLSRFEQASDSLLKVITNLLQDDNIMAKLKVSSLNRAWTEDEWKEEVRQTHVEVELMLESYHSRFESYFKASYIMRKQIAATLELLEISLDKQRNNLIRLNLQLSIATISLGVGAWVGSTFGMNLVSGFEEHPNMFYMVRMIAVVSVVVVAGRWDVMAPLEEGKINRISGLSLLLCRLTSSPYFHLPPS